MGEFCYFNCVSNAMQKVARIDVGRLLLRTLLLNKNHRWRQGPGQGPFLVVFVKAYSLHLDCSF